MLEREVKLSVPNEFVLPDLNGVLADATAIAADQLTLDATYYDTPDLRLARWGCSLRYRSNDGWSVKLPASTQGDVLARHEIAFEGSPEQVPAAAADLLHAYIRREPIQPALQLSTVRRRVRLLREDGSRLAEVDDDEVSVLEGNPGMRFRELEVELGETADAVLLPMLTARLRAAGAGTSDGAPKHIRALGAPASAPPEVSVRALHKPVTGAQVVRQTITRSVELLLRHDPGVRLGDDPEDVHQARVATRRLRSDLRTFRPLLDAEWVESLRDELRWLGGELGAVRDREVLHARLEAHAARLPDDDTVASKELVDLLVTEENAARASLLEAIRADRYVALLERLIQAANEPAVEPRAKGLARKHLPPLAVRAWHRLQQAVTRLPATPADAELHQIRILAKRCRYAAEAVAPVAGMQAQRFARAVANLQTVLGELQDSVNAQDWLRRVGYSAGQAFVAGELLMIERSAAQEARQQWPAAWKALDRKGVRRWLH